MLEGDSLQYSPLLESGGAFGLQAATAIAGWLIEDSGAWRKEGWVSARGH
jgi:hypothetical protein